jgi:DNA polymerase (family 10)
MKNKEIARLFYEIADFLEMQDVEWKPRAYRRAARSIEALSDPIEEFYERGELEEIDGVGESIAEKVKEYLETGKIEYYEELKEDLPVDVEALTSVEGIGPKTVKKLYESLDIKDLEGLEEAAEEGKIAELEGFGEKSEQRILDHLKMAKKGQERMLLGDAFPISEQIKNRLEESDVFNKVEIVGSFRRRRPTVGDIDILATSEASEEAMDYFCRMDDVKDVLGKGKTKSSVIVSGDLQVDIRIVDEESWGSALQYFTGSKDHNIAVRSLALEKNWTLSEYGLFEKGTEEIIASQTEGKIYEKLGLDYIAPELREDTGEVEAAKQGELPELVELDDIKGDLQMHTTYSDGSASVKEMAEKADELGYSYILVTDHGPSLHVAGGPSSRKKLEEQREDIEEANQEFEVEVLQGIEANITDNGIDISEDMLDILDIIVVSMHNRLENPTQRVVDVFENFDVDIFAHPLNRMINRREPQDLDMDRIVKAAAENEVAIEINSQPSRLDLPWNLVKEYRNKVKFVISTDAHTTGEMDFMHLGVAQARRGWLEKNNVLNTYTFEDLRSYFK